MQNLDFLYVFVHLNSKNVQYSVFKYIKGEKKAGLLLGVHLGLNF